MTTLRCGLPLLILLILIILVVVTASAQPVYLQESFDSQALPPGWTVSLLSGTTATWSAVGTGTNPPVPPYAGAGQIKFNSYDASAGEQARLTSPAVNLSGATDPFLEFFLYRDEEFLESADSLYVEVTISDSVNGPWTVLQRFKRPAEWNIWQRVRVSLLPFSGSPRVFIGFRGVSAYGNNIYADEVRVTELSFHDIGVTGILQNAGTVTTGDVPFDDSRVSHRIHAGSVPQTLHTLPAKTISLSSIVENAGTFDEPVFDVFWSANGILQSPAGNTLVLLRGTSDTIPLPEEPFAPGVYEISAWTYLNTDSNRFNDTTRMVVTVLDSSTVFFEPFNDILFPPPGWTAFNRDGGTLEPWFRGAPSSPFPPFEGGGFAGNNYQRANGSYLDDYLITPGISSVGQPGFVDSLEFMVRSVLNPPPLANYPDSLMIMVSFTGVDTSDFSITLDYFQVPKTGWAPKRYRIPASVPANSTIHIAFRYLHYDGGNAGTSSDFIGLDAVRLIRQRVTHVSDPGSLPDLFALHPNYPNPFNATTTIAYSLPVATDMHLGIVDVLGRQVATLARGYHPAGFHSAQWDAGGHASGVYLCRLIAGTTMITRPLILLR